MVDLGPDHDGRLDAAPVFESLVAWARDVGIEELRAWARTGLALGLRARAAPS